MIFYILKVLLLTVYNNKGPWIVQSSVGRKPLIVGGALRVI
jgi:hypothetical protein